MSTASPRPVSAVPPAAPADREPALHRRAMDNLSFIRSTMERATSFTAVPGWGGVAMGLTAIGAAWVAQRQPDPRVWLQTWLVEAVIAVGLGVYALARKARRSKTPLLARPGRRFAMSFAPPLSVGFVLTFALAARQEYGLLPATWLLLYGTGVVTGGAFSIRVVPIMGLVIMGFGLVALLTPAALGNLWMALGFGASQLAAGLIIARRYGG
ncbi:MAG TPA: hypothetical protein VK845_14815 [Gemmatimonadales bacterium]|nr:hypothetical protein [Gemmatimonadales bacterium]